MTRIYQQVIDAKPERGRSKEPRRIVAQNGARIVVSASAVRRWKDTARRASRG